MHNIKFHLMVVTGIILGVLGVFYATGNLGERKPQQQAQPIAIDGKVLVEEASWGLNCVQSMQRRLSTIKRTMQTANEKHYEALEKQYNNAPPTPVRNNALETVSIACNGKESCEFTASWENLGLGQYNSSLCSASFELSARYRCKRFGRYHSATAPEHGALTLDCSKATTATQE